MVIANDMEYRLGVKNTKAFIKANPTKVQFRRPSVVYTDAGGKIKDNPTLLPEQTVRIIPMSGMVWDRSKVTPDEGNVPDVSLQMVSLPELDIKKNDYFPYDDGWAKVEHVSPVKGYRLDARLSFTHNEPKA